MLLLTVGNIMSETPPKKASTAFDIGPAERVMEANWEWIRAEGFRPYETLPQGTLVHAETESYYEKVGFNNVRQGDVYDPKSDRPLRHIPGTTVYVRDPQPDRPDQSGEAGSRA
jgi:hypothetical protein